VTREQEIATLQHRAEAIKAELETIIQRIDALEHDAESD
jgi:hypothetical protein